MRNTRIRVPELTPRGGLAEIRVMIMHPMETGFNSNSHGDLIPVDIITDFSCSFDGAEVLAIRLAPGLSANPYFSFDIRADRSGTLSFLWIDQQGVETRATAGLVVG